MNKRICTIGLIQMKPEESKQASIEHAIEKIKEASLRGANLICLPELFTTNYFPQNSDNDEVFSSAETVNGQITTALKKIAKEVKAVIIGGSFLEKSKDKYYNSCPVIESNGELKGIYRKTHIPNDEYFWEKKYFCPGNSYKIFDTSVAKVAPLICFDQWFSEASKSVCKNGAEIIVYPTAIGNVSEIVKVMETEKWYEMWKLVQVGQSISNQVFLAAVNRHGTERKIDFWGKSFISDPAGAILAEAGDSEEIVTKEIDLSHVQKMRSVWGFDSAERGPLEVNICK